MMIASKGRRVDVGSSCIEKVVTSYLGIPATCLVGTKRRHLVIEYESSKSSLRNIEKYL